MICMFMVCLVISLTVPSSGLHNLLKGMALGLKKVGGWKLTGAGWHACKRRQAEDRLLLIDFKLMHKLFKVCMLISTMQYFNTCTQLH